MTRCEQVPFGILQYISLKVIEGISGISQLFQSLTPSLSIRIIESPIEGDRRKLVQ